MRCQEVISQRGGLHIQHVAPATRDLLKAMGLRDGWKEAFSALTTKGVPTYIFSSGFGDVVAQALILAGGLAGSSLPQNVRIISNFFRTAPDGTVRAFSSPVVHERNKHARTAMEHMGMPLPERKNALVFGAHEDDIRMIQGATGIEETLTVGFLEVGQDLSTRLPAFMTTYDVVVVGDGNFQFVRQTLSDVLGLDASEGRGAKKLLEGFGRAFGMDRGSSGAAGTVSSQASPPAPPPPSSYGGSGVGGAHGFAAGSSMGDIF